MKEIAFTLLERPVTWAEAAIGFGALSLVLLLMAVIAGWRGGKSRAIEAAMATERAREMDDKVAEMNRQQAELAGRMQSMAEILSTRQGDLARLVAHQRRPQLSGLAVGDGDVGRLAGGACRYFAACRASAGSNPIARASSTSSTTSRRL